MVQLNRNNSNWSFEERRKINENWQILEGIVNSTASNNNGVKGELDELKVTVSTNTQRVTQSLQIANRADIKAEDSLAISNSASNNANSAGIRANEANSKSEEANRLARNAIETAENIDSKAERAIAKSEYVQSQLDNIVADGDSNAEVVQGRGQFENLRQRLDSEKQELDNNLTSVDERLTTQLAQKATKDEISALSKQLIPKRYIIGGQLERLKNALSNPFYQYVSIVLLGDSITWGLTATGNPAITPRNGTLTDVRDVYSSKSWANNLKRYIGNKYADGVAPKLTNHSTSPSGESIAEFTKRHLIFPNTDDFTITLSGTTTQADPSITASGRSILGYQYIFRKESLDTRKVEIEFNFTGKELTVYYDATLQGSDYELFVDGVSKGVFTTLTTNPDGEYSNFYKHEFDFVENKKIKIASVASSYVGRQTLRLTAIAIDKKIKIKTQGIIGTSARLFKQRNIDNETNGKAIESDDKFVFIQLGTNDRLITTGVIRGQGQFKNDYTALVDSISSNRNIILMNANAVTNESPESYSFNMQDVKNVVFSVAKSKNMDYIDNYSVFGDVDINTYTADGIHPNDAGHEVIGRNIINAIEFN